MTFIDHLMLQTCEKIETTYDAWGQQIQGNKTSFKCRLRDIQDILKQTNREEIDADAMLWAPTGTNLKKGDIIEHAGELFRIQQITRARGIESPNIEFLKCLLDKYGEVS